MIRRRPASGLRRPLALLLGLAAITGPIAPVQAATPTIWTRNLYVSAAFLYQDPYAYACTAASTMIMLNTIAYRHTGGEGFQWKATRVKNDANRSNLRDLTSILYFARGHDTLSPSGSGSDPHGWRNALNYYGWGSAAMTNPDKSVYQDLQYTSFDAALHDTVLAIARYGMPVGIVTWAGRHAQVATGYEVSGGDPRVSDDFTVRALYISDPLKSNSAVNKRVAYGTLKIGTLRLRFQHYREADSPYDDSYALGWKRSSVRPTTGPSEWYGRYVIIAPIRAGSPGDPPPDPTPTPTPPPDPTPTPTPIASEPPTSDAGVDSAPAPTEPPTPPPTAAPTLAPEPTQTNPPTATPEPTPLDAAVSVSPPAGASTAP